MEGEQDEVIYRSVMENNSRLIGLYGKIGVGKTRILTSLRTNFWRSYQFDFDALIIVLEARELTPATLQHSIARKLELSINSQRWDDAKGSIVDRALIISEFLQDKRFAILIDDVGDTIIDYLNEIGIPNSDLNENNCKVVFTSQVQRNGADMNILVKPLPLQLARCLFHKTIGRETLSLHPDIPRLAHEVIELCDGLPQTLITVAHALRRNTTPEEWRNSIKVLRRCDSTMSEHEDRGQIFLDALSGKSSIKASVVDPTKPATSYYNNHDRFCKIDHELGQLKDTLARLVMTTEENQRIINQCFEILGTQKSYIPPNDL